MSGPIIIQGAMDAETDWLVSRLNASEEQNIGSYRFWRGLCRGQELVICRTEIGELNAACVTTLGIERFAPRAVINQGIAGAHSEELHIGDIVVGESCVHLDGWQSEPHGRGAGCRPFTWSRMDEQLVLAGDSALASRFLAAPYDGGRLVGGRLGSGDIFSREYDRIHWLREQCGHLCEDMESIAVYQVCHRLGVPCLGVRVISNNELTGEPYTRSVGEGLQSFILESVLDGPL